MGVNVNYWNCGKMGDSGVKDQGSQKETGLGDEETGLQSAKVGGLEAK